MILSLKNERRSTAKADLTDVPPFPVAVVNGRGRERP